MLNAWTKSLINHFGGCFARVLEFFLDSGAQSAIFWHLKTGTFAKSAWRSKCHFLALENGHFCQKCLAKWFWQLFYILVHPTGKPATAKAFFFHCSKKGPHFRDRVPIGTFLTFWVPNHTSGYLFSEFGCKLRQECPFPQFHNNE